jgi:eukaryotic-like serine/threonine-protein kinase
MNDHVNYLGQILDGRYRVERLLGEGGMGAVYEGRHVVVGKRVAIKILHAEYAANEEVLKRFYREAQAAAAIGHKNIIDIMDVGATPSNEPYLVMEYLEGEDLESMLSRTGPLKVETACAILEPALLALGAAHDKGIVHRDLKPANIFLCRSDDGHHTVKLIDFGISKFTGGTGSTKLTQTGSLLGTPSYMSPEQARGRMDVDHRTDIYSMGVILYQMLTGALPYHGENYNALLSSLLTEQPRPLRALNPSVPVDVDALVLRELSKDPSERSQSTGEMLAAFGELEAFKERESGMTLLGERLRRGVAGGDLGAKVGGGSGKASASRVLSQLAKGTPSAWSKTSDRRGPRRAVIAGLAVAALIACGVAVFAFLKNDSHAAPPAVAPPAKTVEVVDTGVRITVLGAPQGATILYDGAQVPMNPFRVKRAATLAPLKVEAEGFSPFAVSIVPERDLEVRVDMPPLLPPAKAAVDEPVEREKASRGERVRKKTQGVDEAPEKAESAKARDKKLSEGRRGALMSEDFE